MRKIIKGAISVAFAACMAFGVAGCSQSGSQPEEKETLTVAMELAYPPFETKTDSGEPDGVSVQFIKDFGEEYGYDVVKIGRASCRERV